MVNENKKILVVDDELSVATAHRALLEKLGHSVIAETDSRRVLNILKDVQPHLVLLDIEMPFLTGLDLLQKIKVSFPQTGVIMATVVNDIQKAVRAIKDGAFNYLLKPLSEHRLSQVVNSYFQTHDGQEGTVTEYPGFITKSPVFTEVFRRIRSFAQAGVDVFIEGETGTGKDLVAQLIHNLAASPKGQYVPVNVASVSAQLFESELFGHKRGSFTGALSDHEGYFGLASKGSLFLDEIGEISLDQQAKLLRVLQSRDYRRVGETESRKLDSRVISATNKDLLAEIEQKRFRGDLYYRLTSHTLVLPPLRERKGDVEALSNYFFKKYRSQYGRPLESISPDVIEVLNDYSFPGNVRELEGLISCAVLLEQNPCLSLESFPRAIHQKQAPVELDLKSAKVRSITRALDSCSNNQTKAAKLLGVARGTLNRWIQELRSEGHTL
ncbi:MAG: sigma-54 dependent transcriptional regulator [Planctomycetota bacterium]|nr:sigma-54 dependent transcriptional regulator [Planctomycetota bacterium]